MLRSIRSTFLTLVAFALVGIATNVQAQTYDLANDWSDAINPNGAWAYGIESPSGTFTPFAIHTNTYINIGPAAFTGNQPAWTRTINTGNNGTPEGLAKSIGIAGSGKDFPVGRVGGHTPLGSNYLAVRWTASKAGSVDLSGDVWMWEDIGRTERVNVFVNGVALFHDVNIPTQSAGISSSHPYQLSDAIVAGGGSVDQLSNIAVNPGDTIVLGARRLNVEWFVGMDFKVKLTPSILISGTALLQECVNLAGQSLMFTFRPVDGSKVFTQTATLDADGSFTLSHVPAKSYTLHIKGTKWLAANVAVDASNGNVSNVMATLLAGDADNNNIVDFNDLTILAIAYNTATGDLMFDDRADFNCDGQVEFADLTLLAINYTLAGDP